MARKVEEPVIKLNDPDQPEEVKTASKANNTDKQADKTATPRKFAKFEKGK